MIPFVVDDVREDRLTGGILPRRMVAFLIDAVILTVLGAVLWVGLLVMGLFTLGLLWPLFGLLPAVPFAYLWLTAAGPGRATPGQALCGLRLVRDDDLGTPSSAQAFVWAAGFCVVTALGAIWFAVALVTRRHRAPHDAVAGVTVVRATPLTRPARPVNTRQETYWTA